MCTVCSTTITQVEAAFYLPSPSGLKIFEVLDIDFFLFSRLLIAIVSGLKERKKTRVNDTLERLKKGPNTT